MTVVSHTKPLVYRLRVGRSTDRSDPVVTATVTDAQATEGRNEPVQVTVTRTADDGDGGFVTEVCHSQISHPS
jgi:hypothetical protein